LAVKFPRWLSGCAFVLSCVPSLASAAEPSLRQWAERRVEEGIIKPLAKLGGSRFSRARPLPQERRVRVTQSTANVDKRGRGFVPFSIDVRFGSDWRENDVVGCVYTGSGELFVKTGGAYRSAQVLLGKNVDPVPGVCESASARS
jgi:hypothetical protein